MIWHLKNLRIFLEEQPCDNVFRDKAFVIARNSKYNGYLPGLFDKKSSGANTLCAATKCEIIPNQRPLDLAMRQLAEELQKPIIRKYNIWGADLADMQLISQYNKGIRFLLYVINVYSKYIWVAPL